ncbi:hypothetical protein K438DRAFT_1755784 [Mycena galopus ATCC 62051]|nr:hypothetical protein K438DRAFT_1755784 [Mycena galopus ATCC 62051]
MFSQMMVSSQVTPPRAQAKAVRPTLRSPGEPTSLSVISSNTHSSSGEELSASCLTPLTSKKQRKLSFVRLLRFPKREAGRRKSGELNSSMPELKRKSGGSEPDGHQKAPISDFVRTVHVVNSRLQVCSRSRVRLDYNLQRARHLPPYGSSQSDEVPLSKKHFHCSISNRLVQDAKSLDLTSIETASRSRNQAKRERH